MNALHIFFEGIWLWPVMAVVVVPLFRWGSLRRDGNVALFVRPKSFKELRTLPVVEQKRVLHEADREAFTQWRGFFPPLIFSALLSGSLSMANTVPKVTALPDSVWVWLASTLVVYGPGSWLAGRWEVHCIKPFLKKHIARMAHAT